MNKSAYKNEKVYFFIFWILYAYLAIYFLQERCTYADNSYYLFNIIQNKSPNLEHYRFAGLFTQWLAVIAVNLKLPYNFVLFCFTINPVIYHFCLFILVYLVSDNRFYVHMFLMVLVGSVSSSYFFTMDELVQNTPVFMVLVAIIKSEKLTQKLKCILILFCQLILLFTHPLILVVAGMLFFIFFVNEKDEVSSFALVGLITMLLIKFLLFTTGRDHSLINEISYKGITLRNIHSSNFAIYLRTSLMERHFLLLVLWMILFYIGKSITGTKGLIVVSVIGLYILIMLFLLHNVNKAYIDRYVYLMLTFSFATVLITARFELVSARLNHMMLAIFLFSFYKLFTLDYLQNRTQLLNRMLSNKEIKQIYLYEEMPEYIQQMSWSVPYETLLISTLNHNTKTVLIKEHFYKMDHLLADSSLFLGAEWSFGKKIKLDTVYFRLPGAIYQYK